MSVACYTTNNPETTYLSLILIQSFNSDTFLYMFCDIKKIVNFFLSNIISCAKML